MEAEKKMRKMFKLFGAMIEYDVDDGDMVEDDPAGLVNQERQETETITSSSSRAVIIPRQRELELPPGACFIIKKRLEESDVNPVQSRFLIPICREITQVLTEPDRVMVLDNNGSLKVTVVDSGQRCFLMNFKEWRSSRKLVLNNGWMNLVRANQLKKGDVVEFWCYRHDSRLRFAMDIYERSKISGTDLW